MYFDFVFFTDAGIAISKDSLKLSNIKFVHTTSEITGIKTYFDNTDIYGNYAWTVGAGLRIYPAFVHFIVRVDVGVNVLESIVFQRSPTVELVLSLNDLFREFMQTWYENQSKITNHQSSSLPFALFFFMIIFSVLTQRKEKTPINNQRRD